MLTECKRNIVTNGTRDVSVQTDICSSLKRKKDFTLGQRNLKQLASLKGNAGENNVENNYLLFSGIFLYLPYFLKDQKIQHQIDVTKQKLFVHFSWYHQNLLSLFVQPFLKPGFLLNHVLHILLVIWVLLLRRGLYSRLFTHWIPWEGPAPLTYPIKFMYANKLFPATSMTQHKLLCLIIQDNIKSFHSTYNFAVQKIY